MCFDCNGESNAIGARDKGIKGARGRMVKSGGAEIN